MTSKKAVIRTVVNRQILLSTTAPLNPDFSPGEPSLIDLHRAQNKETAIRRSLHNDQFTAAGKNAAEGGDIHLMGYEEDWSGEVLLEEPLPQLTGSLFLLVIFAEKGV
jgi:hypothetical protein